MRRIETTAVISRSIPEVFSFVIEPSNMPKWAAGYLEGEWTSEGPIGVGSTQRRVSNFGGRDNESLHTVIVFEPDKRMALRTRSGPLEIVEIVEIAKVREGTKVIIAEEVTSPTLLKPIEWVFALLVGRNLPKYGRALKTHLEESS